MKPISLQLYSLREEASKDHLKTLKTVADIGYKGVEPAGLFDLPPKEFRKIVEDLGMVVSSSHGPKPDPDNINEVVDVMGDLGTDMVISGWGPADFSSMGAIEKTAITANRMTEALKNTGVKLVLHNHWWEFEMVDGRLGYDIFMELCPDLQCEVDTYWACNFGQNDPAEQVAKNKARTPLLHIKDGPLVKDEPHTAVGKGKMDVPKVIAAADESVLKWVIVELDSCGTDMTEAVADSYRYLVNNGLASGNK